VPDMRMISDCGTRIVVNNTMTILEDIVDLQARRKAKTDKVANDAIEDMKDDIAHVVAATIDQLKSTGIDEDRAVKIVMKHLSDVVMAHDLG